MRGGCLHHPELQVRALESQLAVQETCPQPASILLEMAVLSNPAPPREPGCGSKPAPAPFYPQKHSMPIFAVEPSASFWLFTRVQVIGISISWMGAGQRALPKEQQCSYTRRSSPHRLHSRPWQGVSGQRPAWLFAHGKASSTSLLLQMFICAATF